MARHALPLLKQASEGVLINLSSITGITGRSGPAALIFNDGNAVGNDPLQITSEQWL